MVIQDIQISLDYKTYNEHIVCNLFSWMLKDKYILKTLGREGLSHNIEIQETINRLIELTKVKKEIDAMDLKTTVLETGYIKEAIEAVKTQLNQIINEKNNELQQMDNQLKNALVNLEAKDIDLNKLASELNTTQIKVQNLEQEKEVYKDNFEKSLLEKTELQGKVKQAEEEELKNKKYIEELEDRVKHLEQRNLMDYILKRGK